MARKRTEQGDELPPDIPFPDPDRPGRPPPDPGEEPATPRIADIIEARFRWAEAVNYWQIGNEEAIAKRYANAEVAYEESQKAVIRYFAKFYTTWGVKFNFPFLPGLSAANKVNIVVNVLFKFDLKVRLRALWDKVRRRREAITLEELQTLDWGGFSVAAEALLKTIREPDDAEHSIQQESLDYFALILATVFVPLARAEMNRIRRNFDAAIDEYERLLTPYQESSSGALIWLTCDFIERPYILLALGETRMEMAEVQFKAASQGKADEARTTYQSILELFKDHGAYVTNVTGAQKTLTDEADQLPQLPLDRKDIALQVLARMLL